MAPISRMQQPIAQRKEHCCYDNRSGGICGRRPHQMAEPRSNGLIECALIKGIRRPERLPETFYTSRRERNTDNAVGQAQSAPGRPRGCRQDHNQHGCDRGDRQNQLNHGMAEFGRLNWHNRRCRSDQRQRQAAHDQARDNSSADRVLGSFAHCCTLASEIVVERAVIAGSLVVAEMGRPRSVQLRFYMWADYRRSRLITLIQINLPPVRGG